MTSDAARAPFPDTDTAPADSWRSILGQPLQTVLLCFVTLFLSTADQGLFSYAISSITHDFGISLNVVGTIIAASFGAASISVLAAGILSDRMGRRWVFAGLFALSALCVGLHSVAPSIAGVAVFRILGFAFAAPLTPLANTLVIETAPSRYRGLLAGALQISYPLGFFGGSLIAAPLIASYGWRAIFYPAFAVIPIALLIGVFLKEPDRFVLPQESIARGSKFSLFLQFTPAIRRLILIAFSASLLTSFAIAGFVYFLPTYLTASRGLSPAEAAHIAGRAYAIASIGYLLSAVTGEFLLTRRNTLIVWALIGAALFACSLWLVTDFTWQMLCLSGAAMFFLSTEAVRLPMIGELFPTEIRGTATAIAGSLAVTIASILSPLLITEFLPGLGWRNIFTLFCIVPLLVASMGFLLLKSRASGMALE